MRPGGRCRHSRPARRREAAELTAAVRPWGPDRRRLGPDAAARLASRNTLDKTSPLFAQNRHFDRLHCKPFSNDGKPVVLFTACPHDPSVREAAMADDFLDWAGLPASVRVDGRIIPVLGLECVAFRPLLVVEKHHDPSPPGRDVLMYRELHPDGFCEHGASSLFFGFNTRQNMELRLCYTIGEFWVYLAHLKALYDEIGLDAPFSVFLSIRNSHNLVLGNYGDEAFRPSWDIDRYGPLSHGDPTTEQQNIQLRHAFGSVDEMTDEGIARAAKWMAERICGEYGAGAPKCYNGGTFSWRLWRRIRSEMVRRNWP